MVSHFLFGALMLLLSVFEHAPPNRGRRKAASARFVRHGALCCCGNAFAIPLPEAKQFIGRRLRTVAEQGNRFVISSSCRLALRSAHASERIVMLCSSSAASVNVDRMTPLVPTPAITRYLMSPECRTSFRSLPLKAQNLSLSTTISSCPGRRIEISLLCIGRE